MLVNLTEEIYSMDDIANSSVTHTAFPIKSRRMQRSLLGSSASYSRLLCLQRTLRESNGNHLHHSNRRCLSVTPSACERLRPVVVPLRSSKTNKAWNEDSKKSRGKLANQRSWYRYVSNVKQYHLLFT